MSSKKNSTQEENADGNPSQHKGTQKLKKKTKSKKSHTYELATQERNVKTYEKDLEESQAFAKEAMKHDLKKLKLVKSKSEDKLKLQEKDFKITLQAPQQPLPFSQTDEESFAQQSLSFDYLAKPQFLSNTANSSSSESPPPFGQEDSSLAQPPSNQLDLKSTDELKNVESVEPQSVNFKETKEKESSSYDKAFYTKICDQILETDPLRGIGDSQIYFAKLYSEFCDRIMKLNLLDKIKAEFLELNNDYQRVQYVLQFQEIKNLEITIYDSKSEFIAIILEEEYNNCGHPSNKDILPRALQLINRSIQFTPGINRKSIGIRLMKRAWINLLMRKFDKAREDAYRSLEYHSDRSVMWNSFEILGHCYTKRANSRTAEHYLNEALAGLRQSDSNDEIKVAATTRICSVLKKVEGRKDKGGWNENYTEDLMTPPISYGVNSVLKCATEAVEVKVTNESGRGLYARRDIKPGDVIIVEKPYASVLNMENFETHCNYCYKRFRSSIPCDTCSRVWFCNEECLKKAKDEFHSSECPVLNFLCEERFDCTEILMFRILLRSTWENIKSLRKSRKIDTRLPDSHPLHTEFNSKEKYFTDNYLATYKLVTNSQKRSFDDLFEKTIIAVYIKQCLKVVNFFKGDVSLDDETFVASLILRHLQSSSCNSHSITEFSNIDNDNKILLGGGIYPTTSLINHSCNPNVFRYSIGKYTIVRACIIIRKGEQLFDSYGPSFDTQGRESRRVVLADQYKFDCDCIACKENWPKVELKNINKGSSC